jgi:hypothetical protein
VAEVPARQVSRASQLTNNSPGIATFLAKPDLSKQCFITSEPPGRRRRQRSQTFLCAEAGYNLHHGQSPAANGEERSATIKNPISALRAAADLPR